jgi:hypothetical protein
VIKAHLRSLRRTVMAGTGHSQIQSRPLARRLQVTTCVDPPEATIYQFPVAANLPSVTEEAGATPLAPAEIAAGETKEPTRSFLQAARRGLSEEELSTPAARRFLIAELERMDELCTTNQSYIDKYHDQRVIIAGLTESAKTSKWNEILSFLCLSIGSAGLGASPSYLSIPGAEKFGIVFLALSALLLIGGIASRVWK